MKVVKEYFNNSVKIFKPKIFKDNRGFFFESYNKKILLNHIQNKNFIQDNISFSKKINTFRGFHVQLPPFDQDKLLTVLSGEIIDIVIDLRNKSKTFSKSKIIKISSKDKLFLYIPKGFAHGFLTRKKNTTILYKVSKYYNPKKSISINYKDPSLKLNKLFGKKNITISKNDKKGISIDEFRSRFLK